MVAAGTWRDRRHANVLDGAAHYYGVYETADDKHIAVGAMEPQFYAELCQRLGVDVPQDENEPTAWAAHRAVLAARFREKTRAEWERQLRLAGMLRRTRARPRRSAAAPAQRGPRHLHRDRRRRATRAGAAVLPDHAARRRPVPRCPVITPARCWPASGMDDDAITGLLDSRVARQSSD